MSGSTHLPSGRLARLAGLAGVGARVGLGAVRGAVSESAANHAAEVLGNLRGLAAKVGQLASYVDGLVPDDGSGAAQGVLARLRDRAASSPFPAVRGVIEAELGAPLAELFASFEEVPFASASIGQVHRARLADGREVAVKVQHPGVDAAIESDLASASMLEPLAALAGGGKLDARQIFDELATRFREELDYGLEAERQAQFATLHEGDRSIVVPAVVRERSARRVLTSELVRGRSLEEAATAPEPARAAYARTLWRYVFKGNLVGGMFNADPHPGNYLFGDDGRIAFVDYGCVEPIRSERLVLARELHRAAVRRDEAEFRERARAILGTNPGAWEDQAIAYSRRCFEPLFSSPYRITRGYAGSLVTELRAMALSARKLPRGEVVPMPRGMLFMNRLQAGFYSVLARLDAEVDYTEVERAFLEEAGLEA
jgi:predicted unusual protein kinase regulating ubiquinone biosynthesis (AarF/ABC1/UbiB family)